MQSIYTLLLHPRKNLKERFSFSPQSSRLFFIVHTLSIIFFCIGLTSFSGFAADPLLPQNIWLYRHKVTVQIPANKQDFAFDGAMELDMDHQIARVIGLGPMITLFDITVTQESFIVRQMHPGFQRIPHIAQHIAETVRSLWLKPFTNTSNSAYSNKNSSPESNTENALNMPPVSAPKKAQKASKRVEKQQNETILNTKPETPQETAPLIYQDPRKRFTVQVHTVTAKRKDSL